MAQVNITGAVCSGGGHIHVTAQVVDGPTVNLSIDVDDLRGGISPEQREAAVATLLKLHCQGMTRVQARNELLAGVVVTTE